jgi:hypothetical protein
MAAKALRALSESSRDESFQETMMDATGTIGMDNGGCDAMIGVFRTWPYGAGTHTDVRAQLPSLGKHLRTFTCRGKCKRATAQSSTTREPAQSAACAAACPHAPDVDTARPRRTRKTPRLLAAILIAGTCIKATVC